jgi:hypothetical protein
MSAAQYWFQLAMMPMAMQSEETMRIRTLSALSAILLAGGVGIAAAQSQPPSSAQTPSAANQGKCFDVSTKQIKDKAAMNQAAGSPTASGARKPGDTMTGTSQSGHSSGTSATTGSAATGSTAAARPPEAAGLPNC